MKCESAKNATPTNETAKKTQRDFGTKALRRDGVRKSTPGGGMALSLMLRVRDAAKMRRMVQRNGGILQAY